MVGGQQRDHARLGRRRVLQVIDQHVAPAARDARADVRPLLQQLLRAQHQLAEVQQPLLEQQPVVGLEEPGELALALAPLAVFAATTPPTR